MQEQTFFFLSFSSHAICRLKLFLRCFLSIVSLMKERSTRQRIATTMALLSGGVMFLVTTLLNVFIFVNGYRTELRALRRTTPRQVLWQQLSRNIIVDAPMRQELIRETLVWRNLARIDENWFMIDQRQEGRLVARDVTRMIQRQEQVMRLSILMILISWWAAYGLSWYLTKRLLKNIERLTEFTESRTIDTLAETIEFPSLPASDSLARLARSITTTNATLAHKISEIQQFSLYAAHELKSPLMSMQGSLDLALKTTN